jgi:uncharacterized membrane protein YedE/YeeE
MHDYELFRKSAIRYWETRRIVYNLAILPPACVGYLFTDEVNQLPDPHDVRFVFVLAIFAVSAVGANVCYTFAYALEFLFGNDESTSGWIQFGRRLAFVGGVLFAMLLALVGGRSIARLKFERHVNQATQQPQLPK